MSEKTWPTIAGFEEGVREPWTKECGKALEVVKCKEMNFNMVTSVLEFWHKEL